MKHTPETMLVKAQDSGESGVFVRISAEQAGWDYLNMAAMRLNKGESFSTNTQHEFNICEIKCQSINVR